MKSLTIKPNQLKLKANEQPVSLNRWFNFTLLFRGLLGLWLGLITGLLALAQVIAIDKDRTTPTVDAGDQTTYTTVISNSGEDTVNKDMIERDRFASGFTFSSAVFVGTGSTTGLGGPTGGVLTNNDTAAIPALGGFTIPSGHSIATLVADVDAAQADGTYSNAVTASSNTTGFTDATDDGTQTDENVIVTAETTVDTCTLGPINTSATNPVVDVSSDVSQSDGSLINDGAAVDNQGIQLNGVGEWFVMDLGAILSTGTILTFEFWQNNINSNRMIKIAQEPSATFSGSGTNPLINDNPLSSNWASNYILSKPTRYLSVLMTTRTGFRTEITEVTVNHCPGEDTDEDLIPDLDDADDDNDGISDASECPGNPIKETLTNLSLADFKDEVGNLNEATGTLTGFTYPTSPPSESATINYTQLREATVRPDGIFVATYFGNTDPRGVVEITTLFPQISTDPTLYSLDSELFFADTDGAPTIIDLKVVTTTGPIVDASQFVASLNAGNGTASLTVTQIEPDEFRFQIDAPTHGHNTNLIIQYPNRTVLSYRYDMIRAEGITGDKIAFSSARLLRKCPDTDGDTIPDFLDLDSDNDGISDLVESGQNPSVVDADGNGKHDDVGETYTIGISNDANDGFGVLPVNSDRGTGDTVANYLDLDSDGDGIPDSVEAQTTQIYTSAFANDGDVSDNDNDGDGVIAVYDPDDGGTGEFGGLFNIPVDTDGDEMPDYLDTDSDGDGESDESESGLTPGVDSNGDGIGDGVGASYSDPDGDTHTGSGGRRNVFRRLLDSDNDTRANGSDAKTIAVDFDYRDFSDFDDIPASFGDASHGINTGDSTGLFLGSGVERDETGPEGVDGVSDTEDDGVIFQSLAGGGRPELDALVTVTNDTGAPAVVCGWLDGGSGALPDGDFNDVADQPDNAVCQVVPIGGGTLTFEWSDLPSGAAGQSFARFRVCVTQSDCDSPFDATRNAAAPIGEVEGYLVRYDFTPTVVSIGEVNLRSIDVNELLKRLGAEGLTRVELLSLLSGWNVELAQPIEDADIVTILEAIRGYLDADGDSQVALFEWQTLSEQGTVGFYAERQSSQDQWQRLNQQMLLTLQSPLGGDYLLIDPAAVSGEAYRYRLIEIEATGSSNTYGPYNLMMP